MAAEDPKLLPRTLFVPRPAPPPSMPPSTVSGAPLQSQIQGEYTPTPPGAPNPAGTWQEPVVPKVTQATLPEGNPIVVSHKKTKAAGEEHGAVGEGESRGTDQSRKAASSSTPAEQSAASTGCASSPAVSSPEARLVQMHGSVEIGTVKLPDGISVVDLPADSTPAQGKPQKPPSKKALVRQSLRDSEQVAKSQTELEKFGKKLERL